MHSNHKMKYPSKLTFVFFLDFFCVFSDSKHAKRCLKSFKTKLRGEHWLILVIHYRAHWRLEAVGGGRRLDFLTMQNRCEGAPMSLPPIRYGLKRRLKHPRTCEEATLHTHRALRAGLGQWKSGQQRGGGGGPPVCGGRFSSQGHFAIWT